MQRLAGSGTAAALAVVVSMVALASGPAGAAARKSILYAFSDGADGGYPNAPLIRDARGALFGTTEVGGEPACGEGLGCGVAFMLSPPGQGKSAWRETVLHAFTGGADGAFPVAGLVADHIGNLYGTTSGGGASGCTSSCGNVFKLSQTRSGWRETVLHDFSGGADGASPEASLLLFGGDLYGTTYSGGAGSCNCGTVFKLSHSQSGWKESVLHDFGGGADGAYPMAGLLRLGRNLYGTTYAGGTGGCNCGTVFMLSPPGPGQTVWTETVLLAFAGGTYGASPQSPLIADATGDLYGTTPTGGGPYTCCGVAFRLSPAGKNGWTETRLYDFPLSGSTSYPSGMIADAAGNLWGTAYTGLEVPEPARVVRLSAPAGAWLRWQKTVVVNLQDTRTGGGLSTTGVIADDKGNLFGTTFNGGMAGCGGPFGCGAVYEVTGAGFVP